MNKKIYVLGNGKSLKDINLKSLKHDSIGMNVAYRFWYKINWFPTYYCCLDKIVIKHHAENIFNMINQNKIQKFFLTKSILDVYKNLEFNNKIIWLEDLQLKNEHFDCPHVTTGSGAIRFCKYLEYDKLIIYGIDSNYINFIPESKRLTKNILIITETPKNNPNYFFDEYQQKGDLYQIPNKKNITYKCNCKFHNGKIFSHKDLHKTSILITKNKYNIN